MLILLAFCLISLSHCSCFFTLTAHLLDRELVATYFMIATKVSNNQYLIFPPFALHFVGKQKTWTEKKPGRISLLLFSAYNLTIEIFPNLHPWPSHIKLLLFIYYYITNSSLHYSINYYLLKLIAILLI